MLQSLTTHSKKRESRIQMPTQKNVRTPNELRVQHVVRPWLSQAMIESRPYQRRIITKVLDLLAHPGTNTIPRSATSLLIESPQHSGKTLMALAIASILQQKLRTNVCWLSTRSDAHNHPILETQRRGFDIQINCVSRWQDIAPQTELLIVDESAAASNQRLHRSLSSLNLRWILGLSSCARSSANFGSGFRVIRPDVAIGELIDSGFLSPFDLYRIEEYSPSLIAAMLASDPMRWEKSLVFFNHHVESMACRELLCRAGVQSQLVQSAGWAASSAVVHIATVGTCVRSDGAHLKTVFCPPTDKDSTLEVVGHVLAKSLQLPVKQIVQATFSSCPINRILKPRREIQHCDSPVGML